MPCCKTLSYNFCKVVEHLERPEHLEQRSVRTACLSGCAIPFRFSASSAFSAFKILFFLRRGRSGRRDGGTVGRRAFQHRSADGEPLERRNLLIYSNYGCCGTMWRIFFRNRETRQKCDCKLSIYNIYLVSLGCGARVAQVKQKSWNT